MASLNAEIASSCEKYLKQAILEQISQAWMVRIKQIAGTTLYSTHQPSGGGTSVKLEAIIL
jgi:hypothetical protein